VYKLLYSAAVAYDIIKLMILTFCVLTMSVVEMALYKAKKAGQTLAAQKKQEEVSTESQACLCSCI